MDLKDLFVTLGGWIVALGTMIYTAIASRKDKQRQVDLADYALIDDWLRRVDEAAFDYYQKASENSAAWEKATYDWESAKSRFNWVMGIVKSLDSPSPLYEYVEAHFKDLLAYENLAQRRHDPGNDEPEVIEKEHLQLQSQVQTSSGNIYKELRTRRKNIWK